MKIDFTARHCSIDDPLKEYAEKRLVRLERYLDEPLSVQVILEVEKHRQIAELIVHHRQGSLQATEEAEDMREALHRAADKAEKQARRSHKKFIDKRRRMQQKAAQWPLEVLAAESVSTGERPRVIKSSSLSIKPMTIDEASMQLERSKNDFFVFRDSATDRVSVLYRRRDNHLGLISPEF